MSDVSTTDDIDPKSTATYRILKAVVIFLGALLLLAFLLVVVGIGMRMSGHAPNGSAPSSKFDLPEGSKILSLQVAGSSLVMAVQTANGSRVYVFDANDGHLVTQIVPKGQ